MRRAVWELGYCKRFFVLPFRLSCADLLIDDMKYHSSCCRQDGADDTAVGVSLRERLSSPRVVGTSAPSQNPDSARSSSAGGLLRSSQASPRAQRLLGQGSSGSSLASPRLLGQGSFGSSLASPRFLLGSGLFATPQDSPRLQRLLEPDWTPPLPTKNSPRAAAPSKPRSKFGAATPSYVSKTNVRGTRPVTASNNQPRSRSPPSHVPNIIVRKTRPSTAGSSRPRSSSPRYIRSPVSPNWRLVTPGEEAPRESSPQRSQVCSTGTNHS